MKVVQHKNSVKSNTELTPKEKEILRYIEKTIDEKGFPPTIREICAATNLSSTASVHYYLVQLSEKQYITKTENKGRTVKVLKDASGNNKKEKEKQKRKQEDYKKYNLVEVPIVGAINAGVPNYAYEDIQGYIPFPQDVVGNIESFLLKVQGESMIKAGIMDGDYILVRQQEYAQNGQIVVALIGDEATVKTFYKEKDQIRLQPENDALEPIIVKDCMILGIVIRVFRLV